MWISPSKQVLDFGSDTFVKYIQYMKRFMFLQRMKNDRLNWKDLARIVYCVAYSRLISTEVTNQKNCKENPHHYYFYKTNVHLLAQKSGNLCQGVVSETTKKKKKKHCLKNATISCHLGPIFLCRMRKKNIISKVFFKSWIS